MQKTKELLKEIRISSNAGGSKLAPTPSSKETPNARKKKKSLYPPIETNWQLPPVEERKKPYRSFMASLSLSFRNKGRSQSAEMVLEGQHNPKDEKLVESFRELLFLEGHLPVKHFDYHTLLRFLRMRDFDVMKARDMFVQYIKWREEFGVDTICKEFKFEEHEEVKRCYPHGYHGVDRYGRPVYIERLGMVDLDTLLRVTTIERFVKYHICEQEKTLNWRYPACSLAAKKHIASTLSILDVKNVGMSQFSKPARYLFMEIQKIDSNYYPETLHQLFIVNAGSGFKVLWRAIKAFLDTRTLAKIRILGTDYKSRLIEAIDPSNLPSFLGGECTCSESGGCLFNDKGPWNDPQITEMLQGMLYTEEEQELRNASDEKNSAISADSENVGSKDAHDGGSSMNQTVRVARERKYVDKTLLQKIQALEPVLQDTKQKIRILETALEDIKFVLQELGQHVEELKG
ncbi:Phosphatidylinositol/phosphatidylcholine transfer protein SFH11 [Sesamum alatum]|uniref:Phosphatidylinositol/phosphatidylcholine transfer protein SFH11 n=1 Tax=Sesamum alatum TaxID=300844 RepID=A0AAE1YS68_9LAMI|nr:Phosphatidylinositol/phosphatidylcholine transfer protein SFH11 [Sesamum alatum]